MATTHADITLNTEWQSLTALLGADLSQTRCLIANASNFPYLMAYTQTNTAPGSGVSGMARGIDSSDEAFGPISSGSDVWVKNIDSSTTRLVITTEVV